MKSMKEIKNIIKKYDCTQEEELFLSKILTLEKDTIITIGNEIYRLEEIPNDHLIKVRGTDTIMYNVDFTILLKCMNNVRTANKNTYIAHNGVIINRENQSVKLSQNSRELIAHEYFEDTEIYKLMKESNDVNPSCTSLDELKVIFKKLSTRFDRLYVDEIIRTISEDVLYRSEGCSTTLIGLSSLFAIKNNLYNIRKSIVEKANAKIIENKKLYVESKLSEPESILNRYCRNVSEWKFLQNILNSEKNTPITINNKPYFTGDVCSSGLNLQSPNEKIYLRYTDLLKEMENIHSFATDKYLISEGKICYRSPITGSYVERVISENTKKSIAKDNYFDTKINKVNSGMCYISDDLKSLPLPNDLSMTYIEERFKELSDIFYNEVYTEEIKKIFRSGVIYFDDELGFYSMNEDMLNGISNKIKCVRKKLETVKNKNNVNKKMLEQESILNRYSRNENDKKYLTNILKIEDDSPVIIDNEAYFLRAKEKYGLELSSIDNKIMSFRLYNDILDEGTSIYTFGKDSFICIKGHIYYKNRNYNTYDNLDISENTKDVLIANDFEETKINKMVKSLDELAMHCKNNDKDIEYMKTKFKELSDEFYYKIYTDEIKSILKEKVIYLDKNLGFYSIGDGVLEYIKNHLRGLSIDIEKLKNKKDDTNYIIADPLDNSNTIDFKSFILNRPDFLDNGNFMITKENGTLIIKNNSESNIIKIHSNGTVEMNCVCSWENTLLIFKYIIEEIKRQIPELSFDVKYNFSISEGL